MEEGDPDDVEEEKDISEFELRSNVCDIKIDNTDLSAIVNGYPDDPIEQRAFDNNFTSHKNWKWWCKDGFLPMKRNALYDEKVHQQLWGNEVAAGDQGKRV